MFGGTLFYSLGIRRMVKSGAFHTRMWVC